MKVKDITEALKDADPEADVVILGHNGELTPFVIEEAISMNPTGEVLKLTECDHRDLNLVAITRVV